MRRYLVYVAAALLTFLGGVALYLTLPVSHSRIKDSPREPPLAPASNEQNKGRRCAADTVYVSEKREDVDSAVVDAYCAKLQEGLLAAVQSGDVGQVRALISEGASPNSVGLLYNEYYYPLPQAAYGPTEVVKVLLDNGANVNQQQCCCMSCSTALTVAVRGQNVETVRLLLARGADVHYRDHYEPGWTALRTAEAEGDAEIIDQLDAAGAMSWRHRAERRLLNLLGKDAKNHQYIFRD